MTQIGLLSDTHDYLHPKIFSFFKDVDEIWHAGDIGGLDTLEKLEKFKPLKAVYGNIDGHEIRNICPEHLNFVCEKINVLMIHIGGYPGRYEKGIPQMIRDKTPGLFISGHSHILKVINDKENNLLHVNPGAAGKYGLHHVITFIRFKVSEKRIYDMEIMEISRN